MKYYLYTVSPTMANNLHGVFKGILNGIHERGEGGVLFVKGEECAYRFASEFTNAEFRCTLRDILDKDQGLHFFVVEERDKQLHVLAYPKTRVWSHCTRDPSETKEPKQADIVELDASNDTLDVSAREGTSGTNNSENSGD